MSRVTRVRGTVAHGDSYCIYKGPEELGAPEGWLLLVRVGAVTLIANRSLEDIIMLET